MGGGVMLGEPQYDDVTDRWREEARANPEQAIYPHRLRGPAETFEWPESLRRTAREAYAAGAIIAQGDSEVEMLPAPGCGHLTAGGYDCCINTGKRASCCIPDSGMPEGVPPGQDLPPVPERRPADDPWRLVARWWPIYKPWWSARRWLWRRWRWIVWDCHHQEQAADGWAVTQARAERRARQAADNLAWAQRLFDTAGHAIGGQAVTARVTPAQLAKVDQEIAHMADAQTRMVAWLVEELAAHPREEVLGALMTILDDASQTAAANAAAYALLTLAEQQPAETPGGVR